MTNTKRATAAILAIAIFGDAATVFAQASAAQSPAASPASSPVAAAPTTVADSNAVRLLVGRSAIVDVGTPIARVSLTSPDVADAMVTTPSQLLVNGKLPGTISMFVWDRGGTLRRYEVTVGRDLNLLNDQVRQLFPGERIEVQSTGKNVVLAGTVSSKEIAEKASSVATGYVEKKEDVVNLLQVQQAPASQVLLRVRFAEVSRTAITQLGLSLAANGYKDGRWYGRSTTQQFAAPEWDEDGKFVFSDFLNLFLFDSKNELAGVLKALQTKGLFQSLAEPNLVAESGKEASFLAGGEIPVPVVQGSGGNLAISILWKEFGIRLNFTPEVTGDRVHLKVRPEVSTLDFNNAVTLQGFRIPALSTRRTETQLELQNGQTFAIAGLMNNTVASTLQKIPGIGDIPILGALFKSKAAQKDQTELVVMITPEILRQNSPGVTPNLPRTPERFLDPLPDNKTREMPPAPFVRSRTAAEAATAPVRAASTPNAAAAAAAMSSLTPSAPKVVSAPAPEAAPLAASAPSATPAPAPAASASSSPVSADVPTKPLTKEEAALVERAMRQQREREEAMRMAEAADASSRAQKSGALQKQSDKAAKVQAKKDAEAAKKQAALDKKKAEADAKRAAEAAKKQAEAAKKQAAIDQERARAIDEAAERLQAAQTAYDAEVKRRSTDVATNSR